MFPEAVLWITNGAQNIGICYMSFFFFLIGQVAEVYEDKDVETSGGGWRAVNLSDFVILRLQTCSLQRDGWPPDLTLPVSNGHGAPSGGWGQVVFPTDKSQSQIWEVDWKCLYGSVPSAVKQAGGFVFCSHLSIWSLAVHTDDQLSKKFVCGITASKWLASQGPLALKNMGGREVSVKGFAEQ